MQEAAAARRACRRCEAAVRDHDPDRPGPLALSILAAGRVADLCSEADEWAELCREVRRPLPVPPLDSAEREAVLMILLLQARDSSKAPSRRGCKGYVVL
jgi:hypothetical protein